MSIWKYVAQEDGMKSYLNAISEEHAPVFAKIVENYGYGNYGYQQPQFSYVQPSQSYRMPRMPKDDDEGGILHTAAKWGKRAAIAGALVGAGALAHKQVKDAGTTAKELASGLANRAQFHAYKTAYKYQNKKHSDLPAELQKKFDQKEFDESAPRISNLIEQGMSISDFLDSVQENYYPNINHHSSQSSLHPDLIASMPGDEEEDAPEDSEVQDDEADDEEADLFPKSFGRYALMQMRAKKKAQQVPDEDAPEEADQEEEDPAEVEDDQNEDDMEESVKVQLQNIVEEAKPVAIKAEKQIAQAIATVITEAAPAVVDPTMMQLVANVKQGNSTSAVGSSNALHPVITLNESFTTEIKAKPAGMQFKDDANLDATLKTLKEKFNSNRID